MTISNMANEPRRELTESAVGLLVCAAVLTGVAWYLWWLTLLLHSWFPGNSMSDDFITALVGSILLGIVLAIAIPFTHFIGDLICDFFGDHGLHLRPVWRRKGRQAKVGHLWQFVMDWQHEKTGEWWSDVTQRAPRMDAGGTADGPVPAGRGGLVINRDRTVTFADQSTG